MPAYVITYLEVTDRERFEACPRGPRSGRRRQLAVPHTARTSVRRGDDIRREDAKRWYAAEYAATIPLRNQSANSSLILVDGDEAPKGR